MTTHVKKIKPTCDDSINDRSKQTLFNDLAPDITPPYRRFPNGSDCSEQALKNRWDYIRETQDREDEGKSSEGKSNKNQTSERLLCAEDLSVYAANIENCIGTIKMPVGIAGPVRVNGTYAKGDFLLPMATTEAALVASYHRGSVIIAKAGGCSAVLLSEGVTRSPGFAFKSIVALADFSHWILLNKDVLTKVAKQTSNYVRLIDLRITSEGNHLYLLCDYTTGDAAGQNMVTIATQAICEYVMANAPVKPDYWFIDANCSGDKKASTQSFNTVRGKKVSVEVIISEKLVKRFLHTTPKAMVDCWRMSALGGVMSGTLGVQAHYANSLAAMFIACGQDAACVAEAAVGVTRFELCDDGALYCSATLPNLIVGTVGGGTQLPTQKACLDLMQLPEKNSARAFAEICAAAALAGEISITGAIAAGDFTHAHKSLARDR
ncbi:MAG: hydroxymethylglutaryl-CoA reductase [Saccharospirillaceae bacterium]|nr:hydroxymethylglutaryl-CoA reductase [Pseudomonadales bacterium]NRB78143.1 hydroxymethylglutaryl-CoA reductase [Saccharospirillaceae bacterium]